MLRYLLFDVFAEEPFAGNQLAVFPEGGDVADRLMQKIANELNIAETVFLKRTGDGANPAKLRIFSPGREIMFAGHPTIGTAFAVTESLGWVGRDRNTFALTERVGDVAVRMEYGDPVVAWLSTPPTEFGKQFDRSWAALLLGLRGEDLHAQLPPQAASAGNPFLYVALRDAAAVDRAVLDPSELGELQGIEIVGVFLFAVTATGTYARMFAPMSGIPEDPATGSATGPAYVYLMEHGVLPKTNARYVSEQGVKMGRRSVLQVQINTTPSGLDSVEVGGRAIQVGEGRIDAG